MPEALNSVQSLNQTDNTRPDKVAIYLDRDVVENSVTMLLASFDALTITADECLPSKGRARSAFEFCMSAMHDLMQTLDRLERSTKA